MVLSAGFRTYSCVPALLKKHPMEELNSIAFERLQYVSDYCKLAIQLDAYLSDARIDISKARTIQGLAQSSVFSVDAQPLEPTVRITHNDGKFTLLDAHSMDSEASNEISAQVRRRKDDEDSKDKGDEKPKPKHIPSFRPFGVLEPLSAKEARKTMRSALEIVCELATLQCEIKKLDDRVLAIKKTLLDDKELSQKLQQMLQV